MMLVAAVVLLLGLLSAPSDEDQRTVAWVRSLKGTDKK